MSKQRKIMILSSEFPPGPGGIGCHSFQLANQLSKLGWDVQVLTLQGYVDEKIIKSFNKEQPFKVITIPKFKNNLSKFKQLYRVFKKALSFKPEIIIASGAEVLSLSFKLSRKLKTKYVLIGHGTEFGMNNQTGELNSPTEFFEAADKVFLVSNFTKNIAENNGYSFTSSEVIPNGGDVDIYERKSREDIDLFRKEKKLNGEKVILTVGGVHDRKGQEWIIRAMPKIIDKHPNAVYYCIGLPTIKPKLDIILKELNIENHVRFLGRVEEAEKVMWLNACDIFGMTSVYTGEGDFEGFGISIIEAALCGKAAVVSDNSGVTEAVEPTKTGLWTKEKDPDDIAEKVIYLFDNPDVLDDYGENAFSRAKESYTWGKIVEDYNKYLMNI